MRDIQAAVSRQLLVWLLFFLPQQRRIAIERWWRGREEYRRLQETDWVLMSWGKSGRTWFRVMVSRYYQHKYGLPENQLLGFDNFKRHNPAIPSVFFSHNNYMRDYLKDWTTLNHFRDKRVVLLVRDPRDVAVSQYFQWQHRMRPHKKLLNDYPPHGSDLSVFDFVTDPKAGVPRIIEFFNGWAAVLEEFPELLLIRYEDMRKQPAEVMRQVLEFIGTPGTPAEIQDAVDFAAYENMKRLEEKNAFKGSGARVRPGDHANPDSYKVRRAKVGGYRDYFDAAQVAEIDRMVDETLAPVFGYGSQPVDATQSA